MAEDLAAQIQNPFLIPSPLRLDDSWIEVVVPALSDLLAAFAGKVGRKLLPVQWPILKNQLNKLKILLFVPG